jgi:hypothetical protein
MNPLLRRSDDNDVQRPVKEAVKSGINKFLSAVILSFRHSMPDNQG